MSTSPSLHALNAGTRRQWLVFWAAAAVLAVVVLAGATVLGRSRALTALHAQAETDARLKVALLEAALERPRVLPLVLADDSEVRAALAEGTGDAVARLDAKLEMLIDGTQASVIYVVGLDGVGMASSNYRTAESFVGRDYSFREYFTGAMTGGSAEHYALGTVSRRPGLYLSRRVATADGRPLGVVVAKAEFVRLESDWSIGGNPVYVTDPRGIVLMTSRPDWRFMTSVEIPQGRRSAITDSLQFGEAALAPLPVVERARLADGAGLVTVRLDGGKARDYLHMALPVPGTGWQLHYLLPVAGTMGDLVDQSRLTGLMALIPALALAGILLRRRRRARLHEAAERAAREELEHRVRDRTRDLTQAHDRLRSEIADHERTGAMLQSVQQELVQANRLAIMGQVAAGVAHEINQPVATIRALADNAGVLLHRGRTREAKDNLGDIAALTDRLGAITADLKLLSRKGRLAPAPTGVRETIEGALFLLRSRFAVHMDVLDIAPPAGGLMVLGNRVRLEQILINLLQNALEAVAGRDDRRVCVRVREQADGWVAIDVADNGPGIAPEVREALFTPFNTSKENGLGLGLVISREIAVDYGGRIEVATGPAGTTFSVYLKKA